MKFYRPLFTCGAFNGNAIMYNTATNMAYYFEGISARLINEILLTKRETEIDLTILSERLQMSEEKIATFLQNRLMPEGLVADHIFTDEEWVQYHKDHPYNHNETLRNILAIEQEYRNHSSEGKQLVPDVILELTYACNERCIHCYNEGAARSDLQEEHRMLPGQLTLDEYRKLIDDLVEEGVLSVTITGGDPFSHPDCWQILEYLSDKNIRIIFQTNGQALNTPEKIHRLVHLGISTFATTIYSTDPEVHDSITRRKGSQERTIQVVEEIAKWPILIEIKCPIFATNVSSYFGIHEISKRLNANENISGQLCAGSDGDISIIEQLQMNDEEYTLVLQDPGMKSHFSKDKEYKVKNFTDKKGFPCSANNEFVVNPVGNISFCSLMSGSIGNIRKQSLHELIYGEIRQRIINRPQEEAFANCGKEDYCKYCSICMAGNNICMDGSAYKMSENFCNGAKLIMKLAKMAEQGIDPLNGQKLSDLLATLPKHKVPTFKKKIVK